VSVGQTDMGNTKIRKKLADSFQMTDEEARSFIK